MVVNSTPARRKRYQDEPRTCGRRRENAQSRTGHRSGSVLDDCYPNGKNDSAATIELDDGAGKRGKEFDFLR